MWRAGITYVAPSLYVAPSTGQTDHVTGPTSTNGPTTGPVLRVSLVVPLVRRAYRAYFNSRKNLIRLLDKMISP